MNRKQRRLENSVKLTLSEARKIASNASEAMNKHNTSMLLSASCLALKECFDFDRDKCVEYLKKVQKLTFEALCASELVTRVYNELGIDIGEKINDNNVGDV